MIDESDARSHLVQKDVNNAFNVIRRQLTHFAVEIILTDLLPKDGLTEIVPKHLVRFVRGDSTEIFQHATIIDHTRRQTVGERVARLRPTIDRAVFAVTFSSAKKKTNVRRRGETTEILRAFLKEKIAFRVGNDDDRDEQSDNEHHENLERRFSYFYLCFLVFQEEEEEEHVRSRILEFVLLRFDEIS